MTDHEKASVLSWRGSDKYYNPYIGRGEVLFTGEIFVSPCLIRPKSFETEQLFCRYLCTVGMPGCIIFLSVISFTFTKYTSRCLKRFSIHPSNILSPLQETKTINCTRADGTLCIARQKEIPDCENFNFRFTVEISCFLQFRLCTSS